MSCFLLYVVLSDGRIWKNCRCSPVYINPPPSYISQSLHLRWLPAEEVGEDSTLRLVLTFFPRVFPFRIVFLLTRTRVRGIAELTRVGLT